jgi:hypothetical protein
MPDPSTWPHRPTASNPLIAPFSKKQIPTELSTGVGDTKTFLGLTQELGLSLLTRQCK